MLMTNEGTPDMHKNIFKEKKADMAQHPMVRN